MLSTPYLQLVGYTYALKRTYGGCPFVSIANYLSRQQPKQMHIVGGMQSSLNHVQLA